jgi:hypothetical protein
MTNPMNTDPRLIDPPAPPGPNRRAIRDAKDANSIWGWVAGGIILLLLIVFLFGSFSVPQDTATLDSRSSPVTPSTTPSRPAPNPSLPTTSGQGTQ